MDKSTQQFLKEISGNMHHSRIDADTQIKLAETIAQKKRWDAALKVDQEREAAKTHPSQKLRNMSDNYPDMQKDLKELLPALTNDFHEERLIFSENGIIPEGKQELETLREMATKKKAELDSKVDELLLSGRSDEYWAALKEREMVEGALKTYNEQLCLLDDQEE